ncbi:MAG: site-specific DNA-methyltransferase [Lachnospiraceae bacterium]|nr:site-specific DNA-methyltransferase [Lachnospiraceae bacterium]
MIELNKIYNEDNLLTCNKIPNDFIDLILTSPPYDDIRNYHGYSFNFEKLSKELYRILKPGGVLVWVVGDATINGSRTCTSFKQLLHFKESVGFLVWDDIIYEKNSCSFPPKPTSKRYGNIYEHMFILVKPNSDGKIRQDITLLCDKPNKWSGFTNWGKLTHYDKDGKVEKERKINPVPEFSLRNNIWKYTTSCEKDKTGHPAIFPEQLAIDHVLSWANEGDIVYDPFMGSGTTAKACLITNRQYIGSEISEEYYKVILERLNTYERYGGKVNFNIKKQKEEKINMEDGETSLF